jgi:hypothetical protein
MAMEMNDFVRLGAQARLAELLAEIDYLTKAFPGIGKGPTRPAHDEAEVRGRRKTSASTRAKMRAAWARRKAAAAVGNAPQSSTPGAVHAPKKRTISAAGKARIAAAQRKRWAAFKKTKKKRQVAGVR